MWPHNLITSAPITIGGWWSWGGHGRSIPIARATPEQEAAAGAALDRAAALWGGRIVTEVTAAETFWTGEDYHQGYFANNPGQPYCAVLVAPKVAKTRAQFRALLKSPA